MSEKETNTRRDTAEYAAASGKDMRKARNTAPPLTTQKAPERERTVRNQVWGWAVTRGATNMVLSAVNMGLALVVFVVDGVIALLAEAPGGILFLFGMSGAVLLLGPLTGRLLTIARREREGLRASGM